MTGSSWSRIWPRLWKDMDTAPLDGTQIMLADVVGIVVMGYWDGASWIVKPAGSDTFEPVQWMAVPTTGQSS